MGIWIIFQLKLHYKIISRILIFDPCHCAMWQIMNIRNIHNRKSILFINNPYCSYNFKI